MILKTTTYIYIFTNHWRMWIQTTRKMCQIFLTHVLFVFIFPAFILYSFSSDTGHSIKKVLLWILMYFVGFIFVLVLSFTCYFFSQFNRYSEFIRFSSNWWKNFSIKIVMISAADDITKNRPTSKLFVVIFLKKFTAGNWNIVKIIICFIIPTLYFHNSSKNVKS